jgi:hypothetical protein
MSEKSVVVFNLVDDVNERLLLVNNIDFSKDIAQWFHCIPVRDCMVLVHDVILSLFKQLQHIMGI